MFPEAEYEKRKPKNWLKKMNIVVGGNAHQHAHADQGRAQEYQGESTYPFVAIHGFGQYQFDLWLLPTSGGKIKHGYLQRFNRHALVLMRGDFVHAGGVSQEPRCHMGFYPKPEAGLVHNNTHHYWLEPQFDCTLNPLKEYGPKDCPHIDASFLWQGLNFPFAYPLVSYEKNSMGRVRTVLTYPPHVTNEILSLRKSPERDMTWRTVSCQRF